MPEDSRSPADELYEQELEAAYGIAAGAREKRVETVVRREINGQMERVLEIEGKVERPHPLFRSPLDRAVFLFRKHGSAIEASTKFRADLTATRAYVDGFRVIPADQYSVWDRKHLLRSFSEKLQAIRARFGFGLSRWPSNAEEAVKAKLAEWEAAEDRRPLIERDLGPLGLKLAESVKPERLARMACCVAWDRLSLLDDATALERRQEALRVHLNRKARGSP